MNWYVIASSHPDYPSYPQQVYAWTDEDMQEYALDSEIAETRFLNAYEKVIDPIGGHQVVREGYITAFYKNGRTVMWAGEGDKSSEKVSSEQWRKWFGNSR